LEPLLNKTVLIIGGTGGIGSETARLLHFSGARVFLTSRDSAKLDQLSETIGIPVSNRFIVDLKNAADIQRMMTTVQDLSGSN